MRVSNSISHKVIFILIISIIVVMSALGINTYFSEKERAVKELQQLTTQTIDRLSHSLIYPLWNVNEQEIEKTLVLEMANQHIKAILVNYDDGTFYLGKIKNAAWDITDYRPDEQSERQLKTSSLTLQRKIVKTEELIGFVEIYGTEYFLNKFLQNLIKEILLQTILLSVIIVGVIFLSLRYIILNPLIVLERAVKRFQERDFAARAPIQSKDEIGTLASTFNSMVLQLKESFEKIESQIQEIQQASLEREQLFEKIEERNKALEIEITSRQHAENMLTEERNLLRTLIDAIPDSIYVKDTQSRFLTGNKMLMNTLGITTVDEMLGKTDFDFHPPETAQQYWAEEQPVFKLGQSLINKETPYRNRETGSAGWLLTTKVPFRNSQGDIIGLVGLNRDVTELKRVQEELQTLNEELEERVKDRTRQLEKAHTQIVKLEKEAVEVQMAGGFAHEMRNALAGTQLILNVAMKNGETLCRENSDNLGKVFDLLESHIPEKHWNEVIVLFKAIDKNEEQLDNVLKMIAQYTTQALEVTTLILDYARVGKTAAGKEEINLQRIIEQIVHQHTASFDDQAITLRWQGAVSHPLIGNTSHFHAIISNLVLNARNALLEVTDDRERRIEINVKEEGDQQIVQIQDTANGIPETHRQKIFEPFFSTNPDKGIGLGLSFVFKLVSLYHGTIEVDTKVGKGTTFTLMFPLG